MDKKTRKIAIQSFVTTSVAAFVLTGIINFCSSHRSQRRELKETRKHLEQIQQELDSCRNLLPGDTVRYEEAAALYDTAQWVKPVNNLVKTK